MYERCALIHYHEIGLKGRNRSTFINRLRANLDFAVRGHTDAKVERISSRLSLAFTDAAGADAALRACAAVPGVAHVTACAVVERDIDEIVRAAEVVMGEELARRGADAVATFAVDARRSSTDFGVSSSEMDRRIGAHLLERFGVPVRLVGPDLTVWVEVVNGEAYVGARRLAGPGGLPVGASGRVVALLSAGIDSPVAAARMMRRGAVVIGVHFSGAPQTSDASTGAVAEIARALAPLGGLARLYSIPFGDLQREIMLACPPDLRVLLYRRLMVRVAERIAHFEGAKALVTGESLGQVASQTLENIAVADEAASMPVLRPLIGTDKQDIITEARLLGTYEISVAPHPDCCTLFLPRSPETHAHLSMLEAAEAPLDMPRMVTDALAGARRADFPCASYRPSPDAPGMDVEALK